MREPITTDANSAVNQSERDAKTCNWRNLQRVLSAGKCATDAKRGKNKSKTKVISLAHHHKLIVQ